MALPVCPGNGKTAHDVGLLFFWESQGVQMIKYLNHEATITWGHCTQDK